MKKRIIRIVSFLLAVAMLCSIPVERAQALTSNTQSISVDYENPKEIVATEQQEKQLVFSTKTESGKVNNFYLSFPLQGGVRFHADDEGFFKPEDTHKITCYGEESHKGEKAAVMEAGDTKVKFYHKSNPWRIEVYNAEDELVVEYQSDRIYMGYDSKGKLRKVKIMSDIK